MAGACSQALTTQRSRGLVHITEPAPSQDPSRLLTIARRDPALAIPPADYGEAQPTALRSKELTCRHIAAVEGQRMPLTTAQGMPSDPDPPHVPRDLDSHTPEQPQPAPCAPRRWGLIRARQPSGTPHRAAAVTAPAQLDDKITAAHAGPSKPAPGPDPAPATPPDAPSMVRHLTRLPVNVSKSTSTAARASASTTRSGTTTQQTHDAAIGGRGPTL